MTAKNKSGRTIQKVNEFIEVQSSGDLQDAMSSLREITVTIPPGAIGFDLDECIAFLSAPRGDGPKDIDEVLSRLANEPRAQQGEDIDPLSRKALMRGAHSYVDKLEMLVSSLPPETVPTVKQALFLAVGLGKALKVIEMRDRHLPDITREVEKMKPGRKMGGQNKRGKFKKGTEALCSFIHELVVKHKMSASSAAQIARSKGMGTSKEANRKRYKAWLKRKPEGWNPNLQ